MPFDGLCKTTRSDFLFGGAYATRSKTYRGKTFCLNENTVVTYPAGNPLLKRNAEFLSEYISQSLPFTLPVQELEEGHTAKHAIVLTLNSTISIRKVIAFQ